MCKSMGSIWKYSPPTKWHGRRSPAPSRRVRRSASIPFLFLCHPSPPSVRVRPRTLLAALSRRGGRRSLVRGGCERRCARRPARRRCFICSAPQSASPRTPSYTPVPSSRLMPVTWRPDLVSFRIALCRRRWEVLAAAHQGCSMVRLQGGQR